MDPGTDIITPLLQYGPVGLVATMLILGWLVPRWAYDQIRADRDQWRSAAEKSEAAHDVTRQLARDLATREGASTELGRTALGILQGLDHSSRGAS